MSVLKEKLLERLKEVSKPLGISTETIKLDYPENPEHGDFSSNLALINAKKLGLAPKVLAEKVLAGFGKVGDSGGKFGLDFLEAIEIAGAGFVNFKIKDRILAREALVSKEVCPAEGSKGEVLIEYTDPNTFKVFHIGHLMSNSIGESLSRLIESSGTKVVRICYPSDIGLHIAKALWAIQRRVGDLPEDTAPIQTRTEFLGKMYVKGTKAYDEDATAKIEIDALNKVIYERSDSVVNVLYDKGRRWSLEHFDQLYKILGTHFDETIYESEMAPVGLEIAKSFLQRGIFESSDGATVFKGENYGLHTRVFINSHGIPTYEAKDLGLNVTKFRRHPSAKQSIVITASEQNEYFKVLKKAISLTDEVNGEKTLHIGHGMMRFASGKMSSRTGNVITAETLLEEIKVMVREKISSRDFSPIEVEEISEVVAVGAIKYTILRSSIGGDIIFDSSASISFEGDSGPYLQYSAVRAASILAKADSLRIGHVAPDSAPGSADQMSSALPEKVGSLERLLTRFSDTVDRARDEYAPQIISGYLINLAGAFNSFYASQTILDPQNPLADYYVSLTRAFSVVMREGLKLLGIKVPKKM